MRVLKIISRIFSLAIIFLYDFHRFLLNSGVLRINRRNYRGHLVAVAHTIEKGLSMPERRLPFSLDKVEYLLFLLDKFSVELEENKSGKELLHVCYDVLSSWAAAHGPCRDEKVMQLVEKVKQIIGPGRLPNVIINVKQFKQAHASATGFIGLMTRRKSVRKYTAEIVSDDVIEKSISLASMSPSVCNRNLGTFSKIDREQIKRVLEIQGGSRGFADHISNLGYIHFNVGHLYDVEERNQGYFDAGLFAMSLAYALEEQGLSTIMLNWAQSPSRDRQFRRLLGISSETEVACLLAFGYPADDAVSPVSMRLPK